MMEEAAIATLANQEINELRAALAEARAGRDEAQRARDKARAERDEALRLLESLTPGGSEFHSDPDRCVKWIKHAVDDMKQWRIETMARAKKAEAGRDEACAQRDESRRERDEVLGMLRELGGFLVLCPDSLDSATCYDRDCGSETCAVMRARAIVAQHQEPPQ